MKRRDFFKQTGLALAAAPLLHRSGLADTRQQPPAERMKRVGCTTVCFRTWFQSTRPPNSPAPDRDITLLDVPNLFAEELGVHNVEVWSKHFDDTSMAYCEKLKAAAQRAGSRIINVQLDPTKHDHYPDASGAKLTGALNLSHRDKTERQQSVDFVKQWMDRAAACGATSLRANTGRSEGREFDLGITVDSFRQLAEHGQTIGVKILVENHGPNVTKPAELVKLVKGVNSPNCRTLPDFGNVPKDADESFRGGMLQMLFPYAHLVSVKGQWFDDQLQHVPYDIGKCVRIGEACDFGGIYSAEYWDSKGRPYDPVRVVRRIIELIVENL